MNQKVGGWEPHWTSPIRVPSFQLRFGLPWLVTQPALAKIERMPLVVLRQTSDAVVGEKFRRIQKPRGDPAKLFGIGDRKHVSRARATTADGITSVADKVGTVPDEPFHVGEKGR